MSNLSHDELRALCHRHGRLGCQGRQIGAEELRLFAKDCLSLLDEVEQLKGVYDELIYAVGSKYKNESRHETALRYIQQQEMPSDPVTDQSEKSAGK